VRLRNYVFVSFFYMFFVSLRGPFWVELSKYISLVLCCCDALVTQVQRGWARYGQGRESEEEEEDGWEEEEEEKKDG
jgi:hypothetical protein